jgi:copper chaperone CopZ
MRSIILLLSTEHMDTIQLKTNIKCGGCVAAVTAIMNELVGAGNWIVDTTTVEKIMSVKTGSVTAGQIIGALEKAGYKAEGV